MATTGFNAGLDSSDVELSYAAESVYATQPAVAYQRIRLLSEGFSVSKDRIRPPEIKADGQASQAITSQIESTGSIGAAMTSGTYDDMLAASINAGLATAFSTKVVETNADVDITTGGLVTTTAGDFSVFTVGRNVTISGFVNEENNIVARVVSAASGALQLAGPGIATLVAETDQTVTIVEGGSMRNGVDVCTFDIQKKMADNLYFYYPGSYVSATSFNASVGGYFEGNFSFLARNEFSAVASRSTGSELEAPTGRAFDTIAGLQQIGVNDDDIDNPNTFNTILQSISLNIAKENSASQFGVGSSGARGIRRGTITITGSFSVYFRNFEMYELFQAETSVPISFVVRDNEGNGYVISLPNCTLMNPNITAGGPDTDLVAEFNLEANPGTWDATESPAASEFTIQIDRVSNS